MGHIWGHLGHSSAKMKNIVVLAYDNCLTSSVVGLMDVFEIGNNFWKYHTGSQESCFDIKLATADGETIRSFNHLPITPLISFKQIEQADYVVIPPVMSHIENALEENTKIFSLLQRLHKQGSVLVSVCTGVFFLGEANLLNGRTVTTNPLMAEMFQQRFPHTNINADQVLIDDADIITTGPTYAFIDLVIYLIEKHCGFDVALQCSKLLLHDKNRTSLAPYRMSAVHKVHADQDIKQIQAWMQENCTKALTVDSIADLFHMSPRNLIRRFRSATGETPLVYLQRLRVELAKKKLEATMMNIDQITYGVGYSDTKSFGRLFKRHTSLSPAEYRKRFGARIVQ